MTATRALIFTLSALIVVVTAQADTVYMGNEDRLSGVLLSLSPEHAVVDTPYSGAITLPRSAIVGVTTDNAVTVGVGDETVTAWLVYDVEAGRQTVVADDVRPVEVSAISIVPADTEAAVESDAEVAPGQRRWTGSVDLGAIVESGDTDRVSASLEVKGIRKWDRTTLTLKAGTGYGENDSEVTIRRYSGSAYLQRYLKDRLFIFGEAAAEHDPARKLDQRYEGTLGAGYDVIVKEQRTLSLSGGATYTWERWNQYSLTGLESARDSARAALMSETQSWLATYSATPLTLAGLADGLRLFGRYQDGFEQEQTDEDKVSLRFTADFMQRLFKESTLTEKLSLNPRVDDFGEFRATSDLAFTTPLADNLSLRLNLKTEYESDASDGDSQTTNRLILNMRYDF